jgi:hypothetical protein
MPFVMPEKECAAQRPSFVLIRAQCSQKQSQSEPINEKVDT